MKKIRVILFGVGLHYETIKKELYEIDNIEIIAFFDNKEQLQGTILDGVKIYSPKDYNKLRYDYIVLTSKYAAEMYEQLVMIGVDEQKIIYWGKFKARISKKQRIYYKSKRNNLGQNEKVLIISGIDHSGGAMSVIYAAKYLQSQNYNVDICASDADSELIREINKYEVNVIVYDVLPYIYEEKWIKEYNIVIVNTLYGIQCACEISKYRPVLWWIHEPEFVYNPCLKEFSEYANEKSIQNVNIYAVSDVAWRHISKYFRGIDKKVLLYGIPDMCNIYGRAEEKENIVFAVIGGVSENKAQDIFLSAANVVKTEDCVEFWLIGALNRTNYGVHIKEMVEKNPNVKVKGLLTREEMYNIFPEIDVVVCASMEETMSIAINEGMMFGKVCITTDNTGVADYIRDGENGFIVPAGDVEALRKTMQWVIDNKNQISRIGAKARETYERYFSMEIFGEKLEKAVKETIEKWERRG